MNEALRTELLAMADDDHRMRTDLLASGELFGSYHPRMAEVHAHNAERLERIVAEFGWPGASLAGTEGAEAAWLVLQHSIAHPALQRRCLPLLQTAAKAGEVPAAQVAYLEDRICVFEGRPQRYGTQFDWDANGEMSPSPLQDADRVDAYRQSVGLGPLAAKTEEMRSRAVADNEQAPSDYRKRQEEMDRWAHSVGWR